MGYRKTNNLYKDQRILLFKECYAMEKIHGTSAHLKFRDGSLTYFSGGEKHENFKAIFDEPTLLAKFAELYGDANITVYGEAYGGKCQGMSKTYGTALKFVAFEVQYGDVWLEVPNAHEICTKLDIEFVHYVVVPTDLEILNRERDKDSTQAIRNGMGEGHISEGVVLRPLIEVTTNNGDRIIAKHKRAEFGETKTPREVSPDDLAVMLKSSAIAEEWCTEMRLTHVLDACVASEKIPSDYGIEQTGVVIQAMQADVYEEAKGEIVESKAVSNAIAKATARMYKQRVATL